MVYEWLYFFAAVNPVSGQSNGWIMPTANTEAFNHQLMDLSKTLDHDAHMLPALDQAGWHGSKELEIGDNITLLPLPQHSPELNPVELVWKTLRQKYISNRTYDSIEHLDEVIGRVWNHFTQDKHNLISLCNFPWIKAARN